MKKIFSLLTLLVLVCSGAWADVTPFSESYSSGSTTDGWTSATGGRFTPAILEESGNYFMSVDQGTRNNNGTTVTGTILSGKVAAGDDFTLTFDMRLSSSSNQTATEFKILDATNSANILSLKETGTWATTWIVNGSTVQVTLPNSNKAGGSNTIADVTWCSYQVSRKGKSTYLKITDKGSGDEIFAITTIENASEAGGIGNIQFVSSRYNGNFAIDNINLRALQDGDVPSGPAYKVSYQLGSETVRTDEGTAPVGTNVSASSPFIVAGQKYYIVDGATTSFTIAEKNNNFTVAVRKANEYSYTVNAVSGSTVLKTIATGTTIEGESAKVAYPFYVENGGKLYTKGATNKEYNYSFTPTASGEVNLEYSATDINNVVYYTEGEDIPGATVVTSGNAGVRSSHSAIGYGATEDLEMVTLPAGVYTLTGVGLFSSSGGGTMTINANPAVLGNLDNAVLTISGKSSNWTSATVENVVFDKPTTLTLVKGGGNTVGLDFFYAQKTADFVATTDLQINEATLEIGKSTTLTATVAPANATRKTVYWYMSGFRAKGVNMVAEPEEEYGEAEINAETGELTPIKAGWIRVGAYNGEYSDYKQLYISPAEFAVAIEDAPSEAIVYVGDDQSEGETIKVTTKEDFDNMKSTSLLNPEGSISATRIPNYIYDITFDKAKKSIVVVYQEDIAVTAMAFTPAAQRIATGNARTFKVTYSPANASFKTATWVSSDPTVATVSGEGFITALKEGVTTITATWTENDSHHTNFSAQLTLTVDKGLVIDRIVYDQMEDGTAEVMGYYHPMDGDTLFLPAKIFSNGAMIPVSFIKQEAFIGSNLKSIVVPGTVKIIDHRALMYSNTHNAYNENPEEGLESAFLMEGVEVMRDRIFHGNKYMTKVFLPSTLTDIGYYSFYGTDIKDVYFGGTEEQWNALKNLSDSKLPETAKIHFGCNLPSVFVNAITVAEEYVELDAEEIFDLDAQIAPAYFANETDLTYTSSNEAVATVDENGVITAVADGTAFITVSAQSGVEVKVKVQVGEVVRDFTTPLMTTWSVQGGKNEPGVFVDTETHYYNNWGSGEAWFAQAYAQFDLSNLLPTDDFKATFTVWVNCARGTRTFDVYGLEAGTKVADCQELTGKKGVELATYSDITTTYVAKEVDATAYIKSVLEAGGTDAIFIMSNGAAGGNIYGKGSAEFAPTLTIFPANAEGGQTTGIDAAKAAKKISFGKYLNNKGQIIIVKDGNEFNALGVQQK